MASDTLVDRVRNRAGPADALGVVRAAVAVSEELTAEADELVVHFVEEARKCGHSWTGIGECLGVSKQAARKRFQGGSAFPIQPRLQRCLDQAAEEARLDGSLEVSSLHLLLGLLHEGVASAALEQLAVNEERLRSAVGAQLGSTGEPSDEPPPLSDAANEAVECAIGLCKERGGRVVGTEHLLFVLATEVGSRTRKLLESLGVSVAAVKRELSCFVEGQPRGRRRRRRGKRPEVGSCSFCGKPEQAAQGMVAGPGVAICADCVTLSREVLDRQAETGATGRRS